MKLQGKQLELKQRQQEFLMDLMETRKLNTAKIVQLMAQAENLLAQADGVKAGHKIAAFEAAIGAIKVHNESLNKQIELMMKGMKDEEAGGSEPAGGGRVEGGTNKPPAPINLPAAGEMGGGSERGVG
jgi:hypothetical protein